jgi:hypothetical protein
MFVKKSKNQILSMSEGKNMKWLDLLRVPIIAFSIVLALYLSSKILDIDFSKIESIGTQGIKLREEQAEDISMITAELEERINYLKLLLEGIKEIKSIEEDALNKFIANNYIELQTVSDEFADLSKPSNKESHTIFKNDRGVIWLGNYDTDSSKWLSIKLRKAIDGLEITKSPETLHPDKLNMNDMYIIEDYNLILRTDIPRNNYDYLNAFDTKAFRIKGIVPKWTKLRFTEYPHQVKSSSIIQYWANIEVEE